MNTQLALKILVNLLSRLALTEAEAFAVNAAIKTLEEATRPPAPNPTPPPPQ